MLEFFLAGVFLTATLENQDFVSSLPQELQVIATQKEFAEIPSIRVDGWDYLANAAEPVGITRLIFIRHGESESNRNYGVAGRTDDSPLCLNGVKQAEAAGNRLKACDLSIAALYSSPMQRARHTASLVVPDKTMLIDGRLHEKFYGPIEGKTKEEYSPYIQKEEHELPKLVSFQEKFAYKPHPEFESMQEVCVRVLPLIKKIRKTHPDQNVVVATHGGLMKALFLLDTAGKGFETDYRSITLDNTGILVMEIDDEEFSIQATTQIAFKPKA
jgi:probable phosphoglycerate mutase